MTVQTSAGSADPQFLRIHLYWPLLVVGVLSLSMSAFHVDFWLADRLFDWEGQAWTLKQHPILEGLIHQAGKYASLLAWVLVLGAYAYSTTRADWKSWRRPLAYLLVSTLLASLLISVLKSITHIDCPWDLARYGGDRPFFGLFDRRPAGMHGGKCFPAGHSSAGYAWISLYFFALVVRPGWRWAGLATALIVGALFGFSQQLRGAHFLSHDLTTLTLCWLVALLTYLLYFGAPGRAREPLAGSRPIAEDTEQPLAPIAPAPASQVHR